MHSTCALLVRFQGTKLRVVALGVLGSLVTEPNPYLVLAFVFGLASGLHPRGFWALTAHRKDSQILSQKQQGFPRRRPLRSARLAPLRFLMRCWEPRVRNLGSNLGLGLRVWGSANPESKSTPHTLLKSLSHPLRGLWYSAGCKV